MRASTCHSYQCDLVSDRYRECKYQQCARPDFRTGHMQRRHRWSHHGNGHRPSPEWNHDQRDRIPDLPMKLCAQLKPEKLVLRRESNLMWCKRTFNNLTFLTALILLGFCTFGCGSRRIDTVNCNPTGISVSPQNGTANHSALPPGNSVHFNAFGMVPTGCSTNQSNLTNVTWSVSDPATASISNLNDSTFGTATCNGASTNPITVTAMMPATNGTNLSGTATLTCN